MAKPAEVKEIGRTGEPCASAADKESCEQGLKNIAFPPGGGFGTGNSRHYLVVARGGKLELVSDREKLAEHGFPVRERRQRAAALAIARSEGGIAGIVGCDDGRDARETERRQQVESAQHQRGRAQPVEAAEVEA